MEQDLFPQSPKPAKKIRSQVTYEQPLAARIRPRNFDEFYGQSHILGKDKLLRKIVDADRLQSVIFYGPPGTGKTTLASIIAKSTGSAFENINAVTSSVADLRKVIERAGERLRLDEGRRTILFVDEIHRFNRAQQDVMMPCVEDGTIVLIGATTQNPSFAIVGPLLSRSLVFEFRPLEIEDIVKLLNSALLDQERGLGSYGVKVQPEAIQHIAKVCHGDARRALTALEVAVLSVSLHEAQSATVTVKDAQESVQTRIVGYDKDGDYHYDHASAFIKSVRGSDPDAAIYWLAKKIYGGEDPRFIIRRLIILASEDIGNADPRALQLATSGLQGLEFVGMPEGRIILAQVTTYLACAPKSNASYLAIDEALADVKEGKNIEVPDHLRDASYRGAKKMGHGQGYQYAHNFKDHFVEQEYVPMNKEYYRPTDQGVEKLIKERLQKLKARKKGKESEWH